MKFKEMKVGDNNLEFHALVTDCRLRQTVNQTPYYGLTISDGNETVDARIWTIEIVSNLNGGEIQTGNVYKMNARVNDYGGKVQVIITRIFDADGEVDFQSFYKTAPLDQSTIKNGIKEYLHRIKNVALKTLVTELISQKAEQYFEYPAAISMHHNYLMGLAYHTYSMLRLADAYLINYPLINADLLYAGVLIHDIGKTVELTDAKAPSYSIEGHLLGHIVIGLQLLTDAARKYQLEKSEEFMALTHLLVSHHGELEYGSPKEPLTLEAYALYMLDYTDSKLTGIAEEVQKTLPGTYTAPIPTVNRKYFYVNNLKNEK